VFRCGCGWIECGGEAFKLGQLFDACVGVVADRFIDADVTGSNANGVVVVVEGGIDCGGFVFGNGKVL
jgi:hypothetical protein